VDAGSIFTAPIARSLLLGIALEDPDVSTEQADCAVDGTIARLTVPDMTNLLLAPSREDPFAKTGSVEPPLGDYHLPLTVGGSTPYRGPGTKSHGQRGEPRGNGYG
jgi:hypothetical protein